MHRRAKITGSKSVLEKRSEVTINYSSEHTEITQDENWTSTDLKLSANPIGTYKTKYINCLLEEVPTLLMAFLLFQVRMSFILSKMWKDAYVRISETTFLPTLEV